MASQRRTSAVSAMAPTASAAELNYVFYDGNVPADLVKMCNKRIKELFLATKDQMVTSKSIVLACWHEYTLGSLRSGPKRIIELAGFVEVDSAGYIGWLITMPEFQGRGIASNLIESLKLKFTSLSLHEDSTNEGLTNFYKKRGFRLIPELQRHVKNGPTTFLLQYYMVWP
jgi:ribosomal protein S18 acetylase RimI-like enzyme